MDKLTAETVPTVLKTKKGLPTVIRWNGQEFTLRHPDQYRRKKTMLNKLISKSEERIKHLQDQFEEVYAELEKERAYKQGLEDAKEAITIVEG